MNKRLVTLLLAAGIAVIFAAGGLQAGTSVEDTLKMETDGYKKRKKGAPKFKLVEFTHKKHIEEYKLNCGECHHDKDGKPLADLKMGDEVKKCGECHNKFKKDKKNKKDIMVHENAMHGNCVECHKEANIKAGDPKGRKGPAPTSCGKCHEKA
ncbi:cytochrome c3 family protein [Desulfospira joergensenii]|uniref:cytochrome c3 family protein n=1 Tax=Desulfospira joergensenii TaxID=53329 RepID=UPI0003B779BB|nr:cytochrome c3 family protein [Desulfospira joergensenii]